MPGTPRARALPFLLLVLSLAAVAIAQERDEHSLCLRTGPPPAAGYASYADAAAAKDEAVLPGVPGYRWRHGCGPTAAGMIIGYWDGHGFPALMPGDATTETWDVVQRIASGDGPGTHYDDYSLPLDSSPGPILPDRSEYPAGDEHADDCLADFMFTSFSVQGSYYGWSYLSRVDDALRDYVAWVNAENGTQYACSSWNEYLGSGFTWEDYQAEIAAGRPMVFLVDTDADGATDHFVAAVGWRDSGGTQEYACLDTWGSGDAIRWERFAPMQAGTSWGVRAATFFSIAADHPQCAVLGGDFAGGTEGWTDAGSGAGVAAGLTEVVDEDGHAAALHLDARAGADYELAWEQVIDVRACDVDALRLRWDWKVVAVEDAAGLAAISVEFLDGFLEPLGIFAVRRHTGGHPAHDCDAFVDDWLAAHAFGSAGCREEIGVGFPWSRSELVLDEDFYAGLAGAVLDPGSVLYLRVRPAARNLAGDGAEIYLDDVVLEDAALPSPPPFATLAAGGLGHAGATRGVCWTDHDGDGDPDLYLVNDGEPNLLLRNDGGGLFTELAGDPWSHAGAGAAAAWADYDNDGDPDLYLANDGEPNLLLRNDGGGLFTDQTPALLADAGTARAVSWIDHNGDGLLDLYLVRDGEANQLFRSYGDLGGGWFFYPESGIVADAGPGAAAAWADYDNDGDQDVYLVQRGEANRLLQNNGAQGFYDVTGTGALADGNLGAAAAWGDYDNDGRLDLYLVNDGQADRLLRNAPSGFLVVGGGDLGDTGHGRAAAWADCDNDGDLDLYLARSAEPDLLLRNEGGVFAAAAVPSPAAAGDGGSVAWADHDGDGDPDLYLACPAGANALLRNDLSPGAHWLHVKLRGSPRNTTAIGARAHVVAGDLRMMRELQAGAGRAAQDSPCLEFGLAGHAVADTVRVIWPDGSERVLTQVAADRVLDLVQGDELSGSGDPPPPVTAALRLEARPNPFNPRTALRFVLAEPARTELIVFDVAGRRVRTLLAGAPLPAGPHALVWDGADDAGRSVASGVYLCRLRAAGAAATTRLLLLR